MKSVTVLISLMIRSSLTSSLTGRNRNLVPNHISSIVPNKLKDFARISTAIGIEITALASSASSSTATPSPTNTNNVEQKSPLKSSTDRFTTIGDNMPVCRLLNGMWQVSGAHGFDPDKERAVADMARYAGYLSSSSSPSLNPTLSMYNKSNTSINVLLD
jgi:hypothetical protein